MILLMVAIGVGAWVLGRTQTDGGPEPGGGSSGGAPAPDAGPQPNAHSSAHNGYAAGGAPPPPPRSGPQAGAGAGRPGAGGWQRGNPPPGATNANESNGYADGAAKGAWERAREDTKRKEEERKAREAAQKRKEELEKKLREAREKEAREREVREKRQKEEEERAKARMAAEREKEAEKLRERERENLRQELEKEKERLRQQHEKEMEQEKAKQREKEKAEELEREKAKELQKEKDLEKAKLWEKRKEEMRERAKALQVEKEKLAKAKLDAATPRGSSYAFSSTGEKLNPWPKGRPPSPTAQRSQPPSPTKRPPPPTAKTFRGTEDDAYSYRPYDQPKKPLHKKAPSSVWSESSYAASQSTSRTTPPPSHRGPYSTKDPNKIVIKAVYAFNNAFQKTPTSQLVAGVGSVTDGLILKIKTEGLFIDDDVRDVPQREWDVKAWSMKLVEVWCPFFRQGPAGNSASASAAASNKKNPVRRLWGMDKEKAATSEETDALMLDMAQICNSNCRSRSTSSASSAYSASSYDDRSSVSDSAYGSSVGSSSPSGNKNKKTDNRGVHYQTGELKSARLHVLRVSIRDTEGKKYLFVIDDTESWKIAGALQVLRKGPLVRSLGVSGMSTADARGTLDHLGWS